MRARAVVFLGFCLLIGASMQAGVAAAQINARMLRYPDVSGSQITFVYAGDIWVVEKAGGTAVRLSSPAGEETFPRFSPDGSSIAFSGNYDGNTDVYVVPAMGGDLARVTYHPAADRLVDWTPDGEALMFASGRASGVQRFNKLFTVSRGGGLPVALPLAYGEFGSMSPDGRQLAFTPKSREFRTWKRYRGGMAPDIWVFDLESLAARNISDNEANDMQPMWHERTVYYISDAGPNQRSNLWAYDLDAATARQLTRFDDRDVTFPAIGPEEIVFQAGGSLYLLDLDTEEHRAVDIDVVTDLSTLRPRTESVRNLIRHAAISPRGARGLFAARGDVFSVPAANGVTRNLTRSSGAAELFPSWSPDGRWVAYWSDRSQEYELTVRPADGSGDERRLTNLGPGYRYQLFWAPDSDRIAFIDNTQTIRVYDLDAETLTTVDRRLWLLHPQLAGVELSWSADGRWLAYERGLDTRQTAIFLFDTAGGTRHQVTSGYYADGSPRFDPDGRYLYYTSNRTLSPIYSDLDATWVYPNSTNIVAVPLRGDVPSPLQPRNDEEETTDDEEATDDAATGDGDAEGNETAAAGSPTPGRDGVGGQDPADGELEAAANADDAAIEIELDGFEARAVVLPAEAGNYGTLRAVSGKVLYHRFPRSGSSARQSPIVAFDLEEREEQTLLDDASGYEISADGRKMIVAQRGTWAIVDVRPGIRIEERLDLDGLEATIDPRAEWRQIFTEVWRAYRDFFYDPDLHGLDWEAMRELYGTLLQDAVTRWDVNFVIGELIGEVNASHTYVGGGDTESAPSRPVGLLGIDWEEADGAYRIARIVRGAPWDAETRSPLSEPGIDVAEGDFVLAVNGRPLDVAESPFAAFVGLAGETVELTVSAAADGTDARRVLVQTLRSEWRLRNLEWIESNRQRVVEASGGTIGYIFVPNTGVSGQTELVRQFNSQMRLPGLIIDERFNAGGQLPDRFVELMSRQLVNRIRFRDGALVSHPSVTHYGHKAMLINGWAGSGGDAFPYFFRTMGVGPIIGERTWGGLIGPAVGHQTIDGGGFTAPPGRIYGPDGTWFPEGRGVEPDIRVVDDPSELAQGRDPQLEAAIAEVLRMIREQPVTLPEPPPFERRVVNPRGSSQR